jgi:hypothetical protein
MIVADYTIIQDDYFGSPKDLKFDLPPDFISSTPAILSFVVLIKQAQSLAYRVLLNGHMLMTSADMFGDHHFAVHEVVDAGKFDLAGNSTHQVTFGIFSGSAFALYFSDVFITYKVDRT